MVKVRAWLTWGREAREGSLQLLCAAARKQSAEPHEEQRTRRWSWRFKLGFLGFREAEKGGNNEGWWRT